MKVMTNLHINFIKESLFKESLYCVINKRKSVEMKILFNGCRRISPPVSKQILAVVLKVKFENTKFNF